MTRSSTASYRRCGETIRYKLEVKLEARITDALSLHGEATRLRTVPRTHTPEFLRGLYRSMLRIRRIEEEIERRYHQDQMKTPIHLVIGQEAAAVGCCAALRDDGSRLLEPSHARRLSGQGRRSEGACCARCTAASTAASGRAAARCTSSTRRVGMAGTSAIVGGAVPIAAGAALAAQMKREDRVVVVFLGDATTEEGVTSESLNFAALKKAAGRVFLREQFLFGAVAARRPAAAARHPRVGGGSRDARGRGRRRERPGCARRGGASRWRAHEPATARRSSRPPCIDFARTAEPATTARPAIVDEAERAALGGVRSRFPFSDISSAHEVAARR